VCQQQPPPPSNNVPLPVDLKLRKSVKFGEVKETFLKPFPNDIAREHLYCCDEELQFLKHTAKRDAEERDEKIDYETTTSVVLNMC
jgi:hypothetical protein